MLCTLPQFGNFLKWPLRKIGKVWAFLQQRIFVGARRYISTVIKVQRTGGGAKVKIFYYVITPCRT